MGTPLWSWKAPGKTPGGADNAREDGATYRASVVILVPAVPSEIWRARTLKVKVSAQPSEVAQRKA